MVELITIGDEILTGRTADANARYIALKLEEAGLPLSRITTIGDDAETLKAELDAALRRSDAVLSTGGLGATSDDLTRPTLAEYFGGKLVVHRPTYERIGAFLTARGRKIEGDILKMAEIPDVCEAIDNDAGAAPGMIFRPKPGKIYIALPGYPPEMKYLLEKGAIPALKRALRPARVRHTVFRTAGVPESSMAERLRDFEKSLPPNIRLAYNPSLKALDLRLWASFADGENETVFDEACERMRSILGDDLFGYGDETLAQAVGKLLKQRGMSLATAESCTGGAVAAEIVSVAGASDYFLGGATAYSNTAKIEVLGVSADTLAKHGAVSEPTAVEMAEGARRRFGADAAVSTTGVAGPDGGSEAKPVGTVCIAVAVADRTVVKTFRFENDRLRNIERSVTAGLNLLRKTLLNGTRR
ncbi:MAG: competence/damage-inducible protein A [Bacteroidia bacterium]|nr:competence/damage-inducible protein A [Bacteroidia bacterium]MDW8334326.1 competence/damage-inducible protein A [Bacteroidia bacterium]